MEKIETNINGNYYMSYYLDKKYIGKIVFNKYEKYLFLIWIKIEDEFRKKNYLKLMLDMLVNSYYLDIILETREDNTKYNKLVNHYIKHNFVIYGTPRYEYDGDILYRKIQMKRIYKGII